MSRDEIFEIVVDVFSTMTEVDEITENSELIDDLELSSIDVFSLLANMEAEFDIEIPEKKIREMITVGDVVDCILTIKDAE